MKLVIATATVVLVAAMRLFRGRRGVMSRSQERACRRYVDSLEIGADEEDDEMTVDQLLGVANDHALPREQRRRVRPRIVSKAVTALRARPNSGGFLSDTPANRLMVGREFRKWAGPEDRDNVERVRLEGRPGGPMRLHQVVYYEPLVVASYFLKTRSDMEASQLQESTAWRQNLSWRPAHARMSIFGNSAGVPHARITPMEE